MRRSQIERGFYPISVTKMKQLVKNCERWGYSKKETCNYVAETIIDIIDCNYPQLIICDMLHNDLKTLTHNMLSGSVYKRINISIV